MNPTTSHETISQETTPTKRDYRQEVTNQIIEMLEKGTAPWQKAWEASSAAIPFNPTSERNYRGGNALHLMATAARKGFIDPRWLTYRQAQENGWQVRQGEKGTQIEYWQFDDRGAGSRNGPTQTEPDSPDQPGATHHRNAPIHRVYTVFNAQQMDGIPAHQPRQRNEWEVAQTGEQILANSGASIAHDQADRAFYSRSQDAIHLPPKDAFRSAPDYYGTALHELAHWTGHPTRLNRQTLNESYRFGDPNYAKEELRAELTSVFLAAERGIPHNPEQHAAYVGSWINALKNDKHEIFRAAKDANTAADYILGLERSKAVENQNSPQLRTETSEHVAAFEKGTATVNIIEKETATEQRRPAQTMKARVPDAQAPAKAQTEKILDGEVDGRRPPSEADLQRSLADAEKRTKDSLGRAARVYTADADSGKYRGEVLGETDHHVLQRIGPKSVVAHPKSLIPESLAAGQSVAVNYSNLQAQVKPLKARERAQSLAR
jgi:antirestriction protein ArdC